MIEPARRHGPFDPRFAAHRPQAGPAATIELLGAAKIRSNATSAALRPSAEEPEGVDWEAFSSRFVPRRRRHDLRALSEYEAA